MDELQLNTLLKRHRITLREACRQILLLTDTLIEPDDVRKHFERHGRISKPVTAAFKLFFMFKQEKAKQHDIAA